MLRAPHPPQRRARVVAQQVGRARGVVGGQRTGEHVHVGGSEVEAFGSRWWNRVGGVASQEQAAVLHRLADERAQRDDALLEDRTLFELEALARRARLKLFPDTPAVRARPRAWVTSSPLSTG